MRIVILLTFVCYWLFLTVLLLVPNPAALVGLQEVPIFPWGKFGIHLMFFTVLGFLANSTRWPKGLWWPMIVFLMVYGITTETLQLFVPHRTAQVIDAIENILGIATGSAIYWLLLRLTLPFLKVNLAANLVEQAAQADAADVVQAVASKGPLLSTKDPASSKPANSSPLCPVSTSPR